MVLVVLLLHSLGWRKIFALALTAPSALTALAFGALTAPAPTPDAASINLAIYIT